MASSLSCNQWVAGLSISVIISLGKEVRGPGGSLASVSLPQGAVATTELNTNSV